MGDRRGGSEGAGQAGRLTIRSETVGAAKKAAKQAARKPAKRPKKQPAGEQFPGRQARGQCPDTPKDFFTAVHGWSLTFLVWASEVDTCWETTCDTPEAKEGLDELCRSFRDFARDAKRWADDVEDCFAENCGGPPGHTKPPDPPF